MPPKQGGSDKAKAKAKRQVQAGRDKDARVLVAASKEKERADLVRGNRELQGLRSIGGAGGEAGQQASPSCSCVHLLLPLTRHSSGWR